MLFFLFSYDQFYPGGGLSDYHDTYSTFEEALAVGTQLLKDKDADYFDILTINEAGKLVHAKAPEDCSPI